MFSTTQEQRTEIMYRYREMVKPLGNKLMLFSHYIKDGILYYTIITRIDLYGIWVYNGIIEATSSYFTFARISYGELYKIKIDKENNYV